MELLMVYPTYTPTRQETLYRMQMQQAALRQQAARIQRVQAETTTMPFYSTTSTLDAPCVSARPRRADEWDWSDEGNEYEGFDTSNNNPTGAVDSPVGDAMLPLMLMMLGYVVLKRLRCCLRRSY